MKKILIGLFLMLVMALSLSIVSAQNNTNETTTTFEDNVTTTTTESNETTTTEAETTTTVEDNVTTTTTESNETTTTEAETTTTEAVTTTTLEEDENETEEDVKIMHTPLGAKLRLLQLETSIRKNIIVGEAVLENLDNETNTTRLEEILDEMALLVEEIQEMDMNKTPEELAKDFVEIKARAKELTKEFRNLVKVHFKESERNELRKLAKERVKEKLNKFNERVKEAKCWYNSEVAEKFLKNIGKEDGAVVKRVRNCELDTDEIEEQLEERFENIEENMKAQVAAKVKEAEAKAQVFKKKVVEEQKQKMEEIRENNKQRLEQIRENNKERLEEMKERHEQIRERFDYEDSEDDDSDDEEDDEEEVEE